MVRQMVKLVTREQTHTPHHGLQSQLLLGGRKSFEPVSTDAPVGAVGIHCVASPHVTGETHQLYACEGTQRIASTLRHRSRRVTPNVRGFGGKVVVTSRKIFSTAERLSFFPQ